MLSVVINNYCPFYNIKVYQEPWNKCVTTFRIGGTSNLTHTIRSFFFVRQWYHLRQPTYICAKQGSPLLV